MNRPSSSLSIMPRPSVFRRLGVTPLINARGVYTELGGSILAPEVWDAMTEINAWFVSISDLLDRTGKLIAELVGAEAARVVPGAAAGVALGVGACMTGTDGSKMEPLPDTSGMRNRVLVQHNHLSQYRYARCASLTGAQLVAVGDAGGTGSGQLAEAIDGRTAAVLIPAHLDGADHTVVLSKVCAIAHAGGVPVVVDAAYMNFPPARMGTFTKQGADLVCFSAKYFLGTECRRVCLWTSGSGAGGRRHRLHGVRIGTLPDLRPTAKDGPAYDHCDVPRTRAMVRDGPRRPPRHVCSAGERARSCVG